MSNKEIRILMSDKRTVVKVATQAELEQIVAKKGVHSVTFYGDMPYVDVDDAWGALGFAHSGVSILLMPEGGQGGFEFQVYEAFMFAMRDKYTAGVKDDFRVIVGFPYINDDKLLSCDPLCVIFEEITANVRNTSSEFEEGIEDTGYDDYEY